MSNLRSPDSVLGYEAEPTDVAAYIAELDEFGDPLELYARASAMQALHRGVVDACADVRARAANTLHEQGNSLAQIGRLLGMSRPRAQELIERGRALSSLKPTGRDGVLAGPA